MKIRRLTASENRARADEADELRALLAIHLGSVDNAAASLGWPVRTMYHRLKRLGIQAREYRAKPIDPSIRCAECGGTAAEPRITGCSGVLHDKVIP